MILFIYVYGNLSYRIKRAYHRGHLPCHSKLVRYYFFLKAKLFCSRIITTDHHIYRYYKYWWRFRIGRLLIYDYFWQMRLQLTSPIYEWWMTLGLIKYTFWTQGTSAAFNGFNIISQVREYPMHPRSSYIFQDYGQSKGIAFLWQPHLFIWMSMKYIHVVCLKKKKQKTTILYIWYKNT